jgi:phosphoenolpyruvate synthase/pyruvate phosphate dikinase
MYSFKNLSKARVLKKLNIKSAKIPYLISFTEKEFNNKNTNILNLINGTFKSKVAIRSSSSSEDQKKKSFAGYFKSFLNINPKDKNSVNGHINKVFNSYKNYKNKKNEVIVQNMVGSVKISGVATSCDKDNFAPYYIINFSKSKDTSKITSGNLNGSTFVFYSNSKILPKNFYLRKIIILIKELIKIFGNTIDLEFAFDHKKRLNLLQVRKIVKNINYKNIYSNFLSSFIKLSKKIKKTLIKIKKIENFFLI